MHYQVTAVGQVVMPHGPPMPFEYGGIFASVAIAVEQLGLRTAESFARLLPPGDPFRFVVFSSFHCSPLPPLDDEVTPIYSESGVDGRHLASGKVKKKRH
jgi:hypothetical protein